VQSAPFPGGLDQSIGCNATIHIYLGPVDVHAAAGDMDAMGSLLPRLMWSTPSLSHMYQACGMSVACLLGAGETGGCHHSGVSGGGSLLVLDRSRASGMWPRRISPVGPRRMSSWPWPPQSARPRCRFVRLLGRCRRSVVYPRARRPDQAPAAAISVAIASG